MKTHSKPFVCPAERCQISFARKSDLRRHEDSVHKRFIRYLCSDVVCMQKGVGFARKDHLTQHTATHAAAGENNAEIQPLIIAEEDNAIRPLKRRREIDLKKEEGSDHDEKNEILRLRAEIKTLQDTINIQANSIHTLLSRTN
jgi:hypothetical protein